MEIDKLARVTGKRRDQIMKEMKDNMEDKRLKLIFNTMDQAAQQNLNGVLTMMDNSASPDLKNAITEMVATGGVPLNAMGQDLIRLNPNQRQCRRIKRWIRKPKKSLWLRLEKLLKWQTI